MEPNAYSPIPTMNLPFELFLALRYLRPRRTFVSVITFLSVGGVTLAVMVLIVVLAVMAGFERELRDKVIGFNAHLVVGNGEILRDVATRQAEVASKPGVIGVAPFVSGPVIVNCRDKITTPILRGVDIEAEEKIIPLKKYIIAGESNLDGESVLVGREWAARNGVFVGDKILVYAPRQLESLRQSGSGSQSVVLPTELVITGVFQTGLFDYDLNFLVTSLANAQYLYNLSDGVHGLAVRVTDPMQVDALKKTLNDHWVYPLQARTWMDQNRPLFAAIATERVAMAFVLFFIMIVAAFGLCSTLITITVQKTAEIGLLKALGASDGQVRGAFVAHGLIVGIIGAVSGVMLAGVTLFYRNDFRFFLAQKFGINIFSADIYQFAQIPSEISPALVFVIASAGVLVCVLAALIPAQAAANLPPAQALRHE